MTRIATTKAGAALLALCAGSAGAEEFRFSHGSSETHFVNLAAEEMARALEGATGGEVTMSVFPNHQLGEGSAVTEQIALGAEIITISNAGALAEYVADYGVLQFPFLYRTYAEAEPLIESDLFQSWKDQLAAEQNLRVLCVFNFGVRDLFTVDREVRSPADMDGLKVRVQPVALYTELVSRSFQAVPTPMPYAEVYSALSQGVIDAAESPPAAILDRKFYEVSDYLTLTNHILDLSSVIMSESAWAALDAAEQEALSAAVEAACAQMTEASEASYQESVAELEKNGMTVIRDVDLTTFQEGAASIAEAFPEWTPGLLEEVKAILAGS